MKTICPKVSFDSLFVVSVIVCLSVRYALNLPLTADCEKTSQSVYKNKYKKEDEQIFLH